MSTPKKKPAKKPAIDLSKCQIGQQARLRNGDVASYVKYDGTDCLFSFKFGDHWYTKKGAYWHGLTGSYDIVELLPPAKPVKSLNKDAIRRAIALLEGLL